MNFETFAAARREEEAQVAAGITAETTTFELRGVRYYTLLAAEAAAAASPPLQVCLRGRRWLAGREWHWLVSPDTLYQ